MSMFGESGFDAQGKKATSRVIPKSDQPMAMVASEKCENKKGTGHHLKATFQILQGEFQNWKITHYFNLWFKPTNDPVQREKNEKAQKIAEGQLSELCRAVNTLTPKESYELHNKPFIGSVKVSGEESSEFGLQNNITKFKPRTSVGSPTPPAPVAPAPVMAGAASGVANDNPFGN